MDVFESWPTWPDARAARIVRETLDPAALAVLDRVAAAAERWHGEQLRPTGVPYVRHLLEAFEVLVRGAGVTDTEVLAATLLHDVVEDTAATQAEVEREFGPVVGELVDWVTKPSDEGLGRAAKRAAKTAYLRRLREAPREAVLVKLADRVSNVQRLDRMPLDFQRRYYAETVTYILPLAETLAESERSGPSGPGEQDGSWFAGWFREWRGTFTHLLG